ncbi:MAG: hypothetical protein KBF88_08745 [Polyangiaceae bacterium]|nr:hypothetical protein [Polyangiaceae bacterium]
MKIQLLALSTFLVSSLAFADLAPPGTAECSGKAAGAACTLSSAAGVCTPSKCTVLDYGDAGSSDGGDASIDGGDAGDAGPKMPTSKEIDCIKCVATAVQGDSGTGTTDAGTNNADSGTGVTSDDVTGGGCSTTQGRNAFGSIVLALGFAALVSRKKNKR